MSDFLVEAFFHTSCLVCFPKDGLKLYVFLCMKFALAPSYLGSLYA